MTALFPASRDAHDDNFLRPLINHLARSKSAGVPWGQAWDSASQANPIPRRWPDLFLKDACRMAYADAPCLVAGSALIPDSDGPRTAQVRQTEPRGAELCKWGRAQCDKPADSGERFCSEHLVRLRRIRADFDRETGRAYRIYGTNEAADPWQQSDKRVSYGDWIERLDSTELLDNETQLVGYRKARRGAA